MEAERNRCLDLLTLFRGSFVKRASRPATSMFSTGLYGSSLQTHVKTKVVSPPRKSGRLGGASMQVRAKFTVTSKTLYVESENIRLTPVTSGSEENKTFFKNTPGGEILLSVLNPAASAAFEVGKSYYVDFTPAE